MHYIVGTQISTSTRSTPKVRPGMTSQQLRSIGGKSKFTETKSKLTPGETYTLTRIFKRDDKVVYTFIDSTFTRNELEFENVKTAEAFISELRNEQVPDYSSAYDATD